MRLAEAPDQKAGDRAMSESVLRPANLRSLFWPSRRPNVASAWHGHVSFGHWLVREARPRLVVELGTHNGVSFASFCNAIQKTGLNTRCVAVDNWKGDEHSGHYGEDVYRDLLDFQEKNFPGFAILLRSLFDDACGDFEDGSVDLLHIDGVHTYEAVKHDFETWAPKLSERAIVLFHDTAGRRDTFGVWRLWAQLREKHPHFEFTHSGGLGVLAVGSRQTLPVRRLCRFHFSDEAEEIRHSFMEASKIAMKSGSHDLAEQFKIAERARLLAEIASQRDNIARDCRTLQSSYYEVPESSGSAVDGKKTGRCGFHTKCEEKPWWMIDLGSSSAIDEIVVYNRLDGPCAARARFISALLSEDGEDWEEIYSHDGSAFGGADGMPLRVACGARQARFVKLQLRDKQFFHLDEVEVYRAGESLIG